MGLIGILKLRRITRVTLTFTGAKFYLPGKYITVTLGNFTPHFPFTRQEHKGHTSHTGLSINSGNHILSVPEGVLWISPEESSRIQTVKGISTNFFLNWGPFLDLNFLAQGKGPSNGLGEIEVFGDPHFFGKIWGEPHKKGVLI